MIRIVGIGSPFGDDKVAWRVIELLQGQLPADIDLIALDRPGAALVNWMQDVTWLLLIDALSSGTEPGSVVKIDPQTLAADTGAITSHALRLEASLRLATALGCLPHRLDIYGIELGSLDKAELSREVSAGASRLANLLIKMLQAASVATPTEQRP